MGSLENRDLRKRIDIEQKFADYVYKDFRHRRYGLDSIDYTDQIYKYGIKKELYNWCDYKIKTYDSIEYESEAWLIQESPLPDWLEANCPNGCSYPTTFVPNELQLTNSGGAYWHTEGPINNSIQVNKIWFDNIPNTSQKSEITIYSKIDVTNFLSTVLMDLYDYNQDLIQDDNTDWDFTGIGSSGIIQQIQDGEIPGWGPDQNPEVTGNYPDHYIPVAQFTLRPNPNGNIVPHFKYPDPNLASPTTTTDEEGNTLYYDSFAGESELSDIYFTLFGNTDKDFYTWVNINGALWYNEAGFSGGPLEIITTDNNQIYRNHLTYIEGSDDIISTVFEYPEETSVGNTTDYPSILWGNTPILNINCAFFPGNGTYNYNWKNYQIFLNGTGWIGSGDIMSFVACEIPGMEDGEECTEDIETVVFTVIDQNENPIKGYEIILDGGSAGFTDEYGKLSSVIQRASEDTKHTVNICYCFETVGNCSQRMIKITVTDKDIVDNTITQADCTPI